MCDIATHAQSGGWHEQSPAACLHSLEAAKDFSVREFSFVLRADCFYLVRCDFGLHERAWFAARMPALKVVSRR